MDEPKEDEGGEPESGDATGEAEGEPFAQSSGLFPPRTTSALRVGLMITVGVTAPRTTQ